jgi:SAM-dependent methyltransferase
MKSPKDNAWYNKVTVPAEMVRGAKAEIPGWKRLEENEHFKTLDKIISGLDISSIVDIGCGAGEIGRVYNNLEYLGADLDHIVDNVSMQVNPYLKYLKFNAYNSDFDFVRPFDIVLLNGFLSEMANPIEILDKILKNSSKHVIVHRQDLSHIDETRIENYNSYGGVEATNCIMSKQEFSDVCFSNGFLISIFESNIADKKTILLSKK